MINAEKVVRMWDMEISSECSCYGDYGNPIDGAIPCYECEHRDICFDKTFGIIADIEVSEVK